MRRYSLRILFILLCLQASDRAFSLSYALSTFDGQCSCTFGEGFTEEAYSGRQGLPFVFPGRGSNEQLPDRRVIKYLAGGVHSLPGGDDNARLPALKFEFTGPNCGRTGLLLFPFHSFW